MRSPQLTADSGVVGKTSQASPTAIYNFTYSYDYTDSRESDYETIDAYFLLTKEEIYSIDGRRGRNFKVFFNGNYYFAKPYGVMYLFEMEKPSNWEGDKFSIRLILKRCK